MEHKRGILLLVILSLLGTVTAVAVTGGTIADPLISLGYINDTFIPNQLQAGEALIETAYQDMLEPYETTLSGLNQQYQLDVQGQYNPSFQDIRVKEGDQICITEGSGYLLLAGEATLSCTTGRVINLANGWETAGGAVELEQRYLTVEDTLAVVTVSTPTAVLSVEGNYYIQESQSTDYNSLAQALNTLGLFKGSDTGYGSGYDLEVPPTRIQGLIMFLRLIGAEEVALATTATHPFVDVADWSNAYVAYAYDQGYTKGVDEENGLFDPDSTLDAKSFVTFILRVLGYTDEGDQPDFTWETALTQAQSFGVLTQGELDLLDEAEFLRAYVAYLSYFGLSMTDTTGETIESKLLASGVLEQESLTAVQESLTVERLG